MGIIPIEEKYLPDELFYSWLCRLSEINLLPKSSFINGYCILNEKNDRNRNRPIALDLKREIAGLCGNLHDKPDAMKVSMDTTTFPFVEVPTVLKDDTWEYIKENAPASAIAEAVITSFGNYTSNNSKRMKRNKKQEEILNISPNGNYIMNNSKRLKGKVVTNEQLKK